MSNTNRIIGAVEWADLTIENAEEVRDFYSKVIGYSHTNVNMGDYDDFCMNSPTDGNTKVGICHARGQNSDLPPQWMMYFNVANLDASIEHVRQNGGKVLKEPVGTRESGRYCFIQDPSGACCALYEKES